ncbi:MAG: hypothetical protein Q4C87_03055 [Actinomycetaceae bacterium]|nr:hypothetical protein [Actinomycetaceae bacterium]
MSDPIKTHEDFLAALERGEVQPEEGTKETREQVRRMILEATDTTSLEQAHNVIRSGRPRLGDELKGPSKKLQVRITDQMEDDLANRAHEEGRKRSDLVREALSMYLYGDETRKELVNV